MKSILFITILLVGVNALAQIDTVIFAEPAANPSQKKDTLKPGWSKPNLDTAKYVNLTLDFYQIHKMKASDFPVKRFIFVGWDQTVEKQGYHFVRGEITDLETSRSVFIAEGGEMTDEANELFIQGGGHKFFMDYEYIDSEGNPFKWKFKWLIGEGVER